MTGKRRGMVARARRNASRTTPCTSATRGDERIRRKRLPPHSPWWRVIFSQERPRAELERSGPLSVC